LPAPLSARRCRPRPRRPCSSPNRTHGPPLGFGSCSPPAQEPGQLTVGTPDANDQGAKSLGHLRINPVVGDSATPADEADVGLRASITREALVPGAVVERRRAIWELGAIRVHDGAGNLFMTQGLFVP
jgi:hypothetical protein